MDRGANRGVVGFRSRAARHGEVTGQSQFVLKVVADAAGVSLGGHNAKVGRAEEVLRDRSPQIPERFDRGVLLALNERLRVELQQLAQRLQEGGGRVQADGRLQIRFIQSLAQLAAELAIHAYVGLGLGQTRNILQRNP